MALMFSALALLSGTDSETLNLATGLPVQTSPAKRTLTARRSWPSLYQAIQS